MVNQQKKRSSKKRSWLLVLVSIVILAGVGFIFLPDKSQDEMLETVGLSDDQEKSVFKDYVTIRNLTSRKALFGDDWIIKGQLFNSHSDRAVKKVKLMFNFDDGVEAVWIKETISAENKTGKKFKERISGHGEAQFIDVEVMEAE